MQLAKLSIAIALATATACMDQDMQNVAVDNTYSTEWQRLCLSFQDSFESMMSKAVEGQVSTDELVETYRQQAISKNFKCDVSPRGISAADPVPTPQDMEQSYADEVNNAFAWRSAAMECQIYEPNSLTGPLDWLISPCAQQKIQLWQEHGSSPKLPKNQELMEILEVKRHETSANDKNARYLLAQMSAWNRLTSTPFFYKISLAPRSTQERILDELNSINRKLDLE